MKKKYLIIVLSFLMTACCAIGAALWIILSPNEASPVQYTLEVKFSTPFFKEIYHGEKVSLKDTTATAKYTYIATDGSKYEFENVTGQFSIVSSIEETQKLTCWGTLNSETKTIIPADDVSTDDVILKFKPNGDYSHFESVNGTFDVPMYAVAQYNNNYYTTIDGALSAANDVSSGGGTVNVFPLGNTLEMDNAKKAKTISKNITINDNVVLSLQHEENAEYAVNADGAQHNSRHRDGTGDTFADTTASNFVNNVTIGEGVTLTVEGTLNIGGKLGNDGQYPSGHTSGAYSQITLSSNSTLESNGTIDCLGYIKEESSTTENQIIANSGTIYAPFVVYDYRGGSMAIGLYMGGGIMPFNQYDVPNLQTKLTVKYGASLVGYADLFTGAVLGGLVPAQHNLTTVNLIGSSSSIINIKENGYAVTEYTPRDSMDGSWSNKTTRYGTTKLDLYGGASVGVMSLKISAAGKTATVKTDNVAFSVPWNYNITLNDGSFEIAYRMKFLSGASLVVESGSKLTIKADVIFYPKSEQETMEDFLKLTDEKKKEKQKDDIFCDYGTTDGIKTTRADQYPARNEAVLSVESGGEVELNAGFGGKITANGLNAKVKANTVAQVTSQEGWGDVSPKDMLAIYGGGTGGTFYMTDTITRSLMLQNLNGDPEIYSETGTYYSAAFSDDTPNDTTDDIYAWYKLGYTVTLYDCKDGQVVKYKEETVTKANYEPPTRTSDSYYTFGGWYIDEACTQAAPSNIYKATDLYAKWIAKECTITFDFNQEGVENTTEKVTYTKNKGISLLPDPAITIEDYDFGGWYSDKDCTKGVESYNDVFGLQKDMVTLFAKWTQEKTYTVEFDYGVYGGESYEEYNQAWSSTASRVGLEDSINENLDTTKIDEATSIEHYFGGWIYIYEDDNGVEQRVPVENLAAIISIADPNGDRTESITLTANWLRKYNVQFVITRDDMTEKEDIDLLQSLGLKTSIWLKPKQTESLSDYTTKIEELGLEKNTDISVYFDSWSVPDDALTEDGSVQAPAETEVDGEGVITVTANWSKKTKVTITITIIDAKNNDQNKYSAGYTIWFTNADKTEIYDDDKYKGSNISNASKIEKFCYVIPGHYVFYTYTPYGGGDPERSSVLIDNTDGDYKQTVEINTYYDDKPSCLVEGTLITLADGSQKKVEDLTTDDELLVFNHETGKLERSKLSTLRHNEQENALYRIINLKFSDGTILRIVGEHGVFDLTLNEYIFISEQNISNYIGHNFYKVTYVNGQFVESEVTLVNAYITEEYTKVYSPITIGETNCFGEGLLTVTPGPQGINGFVNIFELDEDMKYDIEQMQADVEKYGLYTYEDFKDYITEEAFNASRMKYFKIAVGKGLLTWEEILILLESSNEEGVIKPE